MNNKESRMKIKGFTSHTNDCYLNDIWSTLKSAIKQIQGKTSSHLSFEELYRNAYTMVLHKRGDILYKGIKEIVSEHLKNNALILTIAITRHNFLQALTNAWNDHQVTMFMIRDVLMYVDRVYVQQNNVENVYNLGLILFREQIVEPYSVMLQETLLDLIMRERLGEIIDRSAFKTACQMLLTVGLGSNFVYQNVFELRFLEESATFYKMESEELFNNHDATFYIHKVEQRIDEETKRADHYLDPSTKEFIIRVVEEQLIIHKIKAVVEMETGVAYMLKNNMISDLNLIYKLLTRVEELPLSVLTDCVGTYLRERGKSLGEEPIEGRNGAIIYIQKLICLKNDFDKILKDSFDGDKAFEKIITSEFEHFLNLNPKAAEYLSLYIDDILKNNAKEIKEQDFDFERTLDDAMTLFCYLQEKDLFERYYKQHLAKRLLLENSNHDSEKMLISKLKVECGFQFTAKLEGMFKDLNVSKSLMEEYRYFLDNCSIPIFMDLSVSVLTTGTWPTQLNVNVCNIPAVPRDAFETFRRFYLAKHGGRHLTLQPQLGTVDLTAVFHSASKDGGLVSKKYVISTWTYQMCILMLFNTHRSLTFSEIINETNIPENQVLRGLQALATGKLNQRILIKNPKTKEIKKTDVFTVNDAFTSKLHRIKVRPVVSKCETESEYKETRNKIHDSRRYEIEAAIVRVMKSRKELNHGILMSEVIELLKSRFHPRPDDIKKNIESLIDREYIARASSDRKMYVYLA